MEAQQTQITNQIPQATTTRSMGGGRKVLTAILIIIFLVIVIGGIVYLFVSYGQKKAAGKTVIENSLVFADQVEAVNDLISNERLNNPFMETEGIVVVNKKLEEEMDAIKEAKEKTEVILNSTNKPNYRTRDLSAMLGEYANDFGTLLSDYNNFYTYHYKFNNVLIDHVNLTQKLNDEFDRAVTEDQKIQNLEEMVKSDDALLNKLNEITPPPKLTDYHSRINEHFVNYRELFSQYVIAINDEGDIKGKWTAYQDFLNDTNRLNEIDKLDDAYFDNLRQRFKDQRERAHEIRTKIIEKRTKFDVNTQTINIENW